MVLFDKLSSQFAATANKKGIFILLNCRMDEFVISVVKSFFCVTLVATFSQALGLVPNKQKHYNVWWTLKLLIHIP